MAYKRTICKGCRTCENNICLYPPKIKRNKKELFCPCLICLIKGMCTNACDKSIEYDFKVKNKNQKGN